MNGLEAVEINLTCVKSDNPAGRIDSEFFRKRFLTFPRFANRLDEFASIKSGTTPPDRDDDLKDGVVLLKTTDIRNSLLLTTDSYYHISPEIADRMRETKLIPRDVLINIVGATTDVIGRVAFVPEDFPEANITQAMALIRVHEKEICPHTLFAFLAGRYGKTQIERLARPTGQYNLNLQEVSSIRLPRVSAEFSKEVLQNMDAAYSAASKAEEVMFKAEQDLICALGLKDWQPANQNTAIKSFSQSFNTSGRLDAEYYQPKYDAILEKLELVKSAKLGDFVSIRKSIEPGSDAYGDEGLPFVRISDISKHGITPPSIYVSPNVADNIEKLKPRKDTILLSKDGSVGIAYKLEEDFDGITSGALLHLHVTDERVLPDYLTLVLNSITTQMQAERDAGGSIIQHWRPEQIREVVIPILPLEVQQTIAEKVQASFSARRQSQQLLELAKQTVERAIESSEAEALEWLEVQLRQVA